MHDPAMWRLERGRAAGVTQAAAPESCDLGCTALWEHPLDLWLSTQSIQHWPSLVIKVRRLRDDALCWLRDSSACIAVWEGQFKNENWCIWGAACGKQRGAVIVQCKA